MNMYLIRFNNISKMPLVLYLDYIYTFINNICFNTYIYIYIYIYNFFL